MSLFWRIFLLNAVVVTAAFALLMVGPFTVSTPVLLTEAMILTGVLVVMLVANAGLLRIGLAPLERLARTMTTVDLLRPGHRLAVTGRSGIADLIRSFNTMLDRLEAERAASAARALSAQEAERQRIAQELHDEVGQTLTAVLLELKRVADHAPEPVCGEVRQVQETVRNGLDEIRRIARRLRPGVLEELGLASALKSLAGEFSTPGVTVRRTIDSDLPDLGKETELVLYRVAQESLTNTARHSGARQVTLSLSYVPVPVRAATGLGPASAPTAATSRGFDRLLPSPGGRSALDSDPPGTDAGHPDSERPGTAPGWPGFERAGTAPGWPGFERAGTAPGWQGFERAGTAPGRPGSERPGSERGDAGWVELRIRDDGRGVGGAPEGAGVRGMRERALLIGADLTVGPAPGRGTEVVLRVPLGGEEHHE
ncbi:histidine kinase [Actinoplanes subglobosus]|uniref:histidine kinase n=1 Tax=Actinoplanes subglobosus TaxID=1547892 RepID=A0ABV8IQE7_9ACTN